MTGQARSAASRHCKGDGLTMMRNPPTAIVSDPAVARTCSRLSATSASNSASRQVVSKLSSCLRGREEVEIDVGDAGDDLYQDYRGDDAEDNACRAGRSRGHGKEHGVSDKDREREPDSQRDRIRLQSGRQGGGEHREGRAN